MKRSGPLRRNTPLKRGAPLKKGKRSKGVPKDIYAEVVERDGGCIAVSIWPDVACWGRLDPHHVLRRSQGGQDTADNLVTLCRAHHSAVHENISRARTLGLLKHPTANTETEEQ